MIYDIADLRIDIQNRCTYTDKFCEKYLSSDQEKKADIIVKVTQEEFMEEKKCSEGFSDGYIENICLYRNICKQLPVLNRFLLHAAILDYKGDGYAFLGRSGAGKTTHTSLWLQYLSSAKIINGDKPILHYDGNEFYAYGTPWMGKEGRGEKSKTKIKGLCFIEKAPENRIEKITGSELVNRIFTQVLLPEDEENAQATLELLDLFVRNTPAYVLYCTISEEAVKTSFEKMTGRKYEDEKNKE